MKFRLLPLLALFPFVAPLPAATRTYFGADNGNWNVAGNWSPSGTPMGGVAGAGDDVVLGTHSAGTADLHVTLNTGLINSTGYFNSVTLNSSALTGSMILNLTTNGTLGTYALAVGTTSSANTLNQNGGSMLGVANFDLGLGSTGNTYNLSGAGTTLELFNPSFVGLGAIVIGRGSGASGTGVLNQSGGLLDASVTGGSVTLGLNANGTGTYNLSGGQAIIYTLRVGQAGTGTFNFSGGQLTIDNTLTISSTAGTATFNQSGGTLSAFPGFFSIGQNGTFNLQAGGSLNTVPTLTTGGSFNHSGGTLGAAAGFDLQGGTVRLNGNNATLIQLSGPAGSVRNAGGAPATLTLNYAGASAQTLGAQLTDGGAGSLGLKLGGTGTTILTAPNNYSGATTINSGTLQAGTNGAFSVASAVTLAGGTLDAGAFSVAIPSLAGSAGTVTVGAAGQLSIGSGNNATTFAGALAGTGTISKIGSGTLTLSGGGSFSGTLNVSSGAVTVGAINGLPVGANVTFGGLGLLNLAADQTLGSLASGAGNAVAFTNNATLSLGAGNASFTSGTLYTGTGSLVKNGTGTLTLGYGASDSAPGPGAGIAFFLNAGQLTLDKAAGSNAISGAVTLAGGTLLLNRNHQIADTSLVTLNGGTFQLAGFSETIGGLAGNAGSVLLGGGSLTVANGVAGSFGGAVSGAGTFTKSGAGDLTLSNAAGVTGAFAANAGRLILQGPLAAGTYAANSGGILRFDSTAVNLTSVSLQANAGGSVEYINTSLTGGFLRGPGTHSIVAGGVTSFNGVTTFNSTNLVQNGPATLNNFSNGGLLPNNAPLVFNGGVNSDSGVLNVASTVTTSDFTSRGQINIQSGGALTNQVSSLVFGGGSRTTINAGGVLTLLGGTAAELNGGLLTNNGILNGTLNVNYGGTARGAGVFGIVNVGDGGRFIPGSGPFSVAVQALNLQSAGVWRFELADASAAQAIPAIRNDGLLALSAIPGPLTQFRFELATVSAAGVPGLALHFDPAQAHDFILARNAGGIAGFDPAAFSIDASAFLNPTQGGHFSIVAQGSDLVLHFDPVPEPGVSAALAAGGLGAALLAFRRRRTHRG